MIDVNTIFHLLGAFAFTFFGVKTFGETHRRLSGDRLKSSISLMRKNRFTGLLGGIGISLVSFSATEISLLIVSSVSTGILTALESIPFLLGAGIGSVLYSWLIALFGFWLPLTIFFPLAGIALIFYFFQDKQHRIYGDLIIGFCLIFLGIHELRNILPQADPSVLYPIFQNRMSHTLGEFLLFVIIGTLFTSLWKSSNATFVMLFLLSSKGWLGYELALAAILGANIGSVLAARLSAQNYNEAARSTARIFLLIKVLGVCWCFFLLPWLGTWLKSFTFLLTGEDPYHKAQVIPVALVLFHSLFNGINALVLINFPKKVAWIESRMGSSKEPEDNSLLELSPNLIIHPEMAILQAKAEAKKMAEIQEEAFSCLLSMINSSDVDEKEALSKQIASYEKVSDEREDKIGNFLTLLGEHHLSHINATRVSSLYKIIDNLESQTDRILSMSHFVLRSSIPYNRLPEQLRNSVRILASHIQDAFSYMRQNMEAEEGFYLEGADIKEREINDFWKIFKEGNQSSIEMNEYSYHAGGLVSDIMDNLEHLGNYIHNVSQATTGLK